MAEPDLQRLDVHVGIETFHVEPGSRLSFGRSRSADVTIGISPDGDADSSVSRESGYFEATESVWRLFATGNSLVVNDFEGNRITVLRGRFYDISRPHTAVLVEGIETWTLDVQYPESALPVAVSRSPRRFDEAETLRANPVRLTESQWRAVLAILEPLSRGEPDGATYAAAAARLGPGWTAHIVLGHFREAVRKFSTAGFRGLNRMSGLRDANVKRTLYQALLDRGLLTVEDFKQLER